MGRHIIVSRHPAAIEFIRGASEAFMEAPVIESATEGDVKNKIVAGNLPLHLAALALEVWAVEFDGTPPRGKEFTLEDMENAGVKLVPYTIRTGLVKGPCASCGKEGSRFWQDADDFYCGASDCDEAYYRAVARN